MKKVSIIILLTVLLLSAFTACNGDVFSELMPKPEPTSKGTITLKIPEGWTKVSFDKSDTSDKTKELEIPEDCDTWAEYLEEVTDIKVYHVHTPDSVDEFILQVVDNKVYFCWEDPVFICNFGLGLNDSKGLPETVDASADIVIGGTYTLTEGSPS